jgi:hypothetical protein
MTYAMFSDEALVKFRSFCGAAGFTKPPRPQGAFDQAMKARKENTMLARYRYLPVPHTANTLFTRERASMAFDEASHVTDLAQEIIDFLRDKISEQDMARVEEMLKIKPA